MPNFMRKQPVNRPEQTHRADAGSAARSPVGTIMPPAFSAAFSAAVAIAGLALYGFTTAPGIVELFDDTLEFQVVGPTFGIAHPTGYPLYILLGGLWSRLLFPIGEWAWRMNFFSAVCGAIAMGGVAWVALQISPLPRLLRLAAALCAVLAFGLIPVWWSQTTVAEVYALHILLVVTALGLTLHALAFPQTATRPTSSPSARQIRRITVLCLVLGLGLAHHRTTVLLLPAIGIVLLWRIPGLLRPEKHWLHWITALLTPLLLYLWLPLRAAMGVQDLHGSYTNTWAGFWNHVLARDYVAFFSENPLAVARTPAGWLALGAEQMGYPALMLALLGLVGFPLVHKRITPGWLLITLAGFTNLLFALFYRVGDVEVFLLPAFLCLAWLAALGLNAIGMALGVPYTPGAPPTALRHTWPATSIATTIITVTLLLLLALGTGGRAAFARHPNPWAAHDYAVQLARVEFPPQSRVIGIEGEITALHYMQLAHGWGENAQGIVANAPEQRRAAINAALGDGHPVYLTREVEGIAEHYRFSGHGPLVRVWPPDTHFGPDILPPLPQTVDYTLEGAPMHLAAAQLEQLNLPGGPRLQITLDWEARAPLEAVYKLSLRVVDQPGGTPLATADGRPATDDVFPLRQVVLTPQWPVGIPMRDVHTLPLPHDLPATAQLQIIVYAADTVAEVGRWETPLHFHATHTLEP